MTSRARPWAIVALGAGLAVACAPRKGLKKDLSTNLPPADAGATAPTVPGVESGEANLRGAEFSQAPDLKTIHFQYDAYALQDEARAILRKNAEYLKEHPDLEILVAGHCDERGTTEYNLALGQKRAKEVREYYLRLGVPGKTVATISYGKEKPLCTESSEACWADNRRAETRIRARTASSESAETPKSPR